MYEYNINGKYIINIKESFTELNQSPLEPTDTPTITTPSPLLNNLNQFFLLLKMTK